MPGISKKRLDQVRKAVELSFADDEEQLDAVKKGLDGLSAAIEKGETVTPEDLADILGEVVVEKAVRQEPEEVDEANDPLAPIFKGIFDQLFSDDGTIRKGLKPADAQAVLQKAYEASLGELDGAIEGAVEAAAVEFGKRGAVKPKKPAEGDGDGDMDDMEKLLKGAGIPSAVIKKIGTLQGRVDELETKDKLVRFEKMAEEMGEGAEFAKTLLAISEADPKAFEEITKRLTSKNELLKKSNLWSREIGDGNRSTAANSYEQLKAHAEELRKTMKKPDGRPVTFAKAFSEACSIHPELYQSYTRERDGK